MQSLIRTGTVLLVACAVAGAPRGHAIAQGAPGGPPVVGVTEVHSRPVTTTSQYIGRVRAVDSVALVARVTAFLEQRLFTEGAEVKKGQLLYLLEQGPFQAQVLAQQGNLAQAQANVVNSSVNFERQKTLLHTPAGQQQAYDNALATARGNAGAVLTAQGNLQAAQINLAYTEIRAPIDGRITQTAVNQGNVVSPTSGTLATIVSQDPMYIEFPVASRDVVSLQKKYAPAGGLAAARIGLQLTNGDNYDQNGTLDYVSPQVSTSTDTVTLRAKVPNPERGGGDNGGVSTRELRDGAFVTVLISDPHPVNSMIIPRAAVLSDQQGDFVYVLDAQNRAQRANVKLGETQEADQVVLSGLKDGDRIVVDGLQRVHLGGPVTPAAPQAGVTDPGPNPGGKSGGERSSSAGGEAARNGAGAPAQPAGAVPDRR
jgi:membrane fusion protein, multidrug efflux system